MFPQSPQLHARVCRRLCKEAAGAVRASPIFDSVDIHGKASDGRQIRSLRGETGTRTERTSVLIKAMVSQGPHLAACGVLLPAVALQLLNMGMGTDTNTGDIPAPPEGPRSGRG